MFDLPEPFGPDDDADARLELERGLVGEGLEALQGQRLAGTTRPPLRTPIVGAPTAIATRDLGRERGRIRPRQTRSADRETAASPTGAISLDLDGVDPGARRTRRGTRRSRARPRPPVPSNSASTAPSPRLRTQPPHARRRACSRQRVPEPHALHAARSRRRGHGRRSDRAPQVVRPGRPRSRTSSGSRSGPGATARRQRGHAWPSRSYTWWWCLVLARLAEQVDVLLVGERRAPVLHRVLQRLEDRAVQAPDLLLRERVAHAVPLAGPAWKRISSL